MATYVPTYHLFQILFVFALVAEVYDVNASWDEKEELWLEPLYEWIEGLRDQPGYRSIFPYANSIVQESANAGYFGGLLYLILQQACPALLASVGIAAKLALLPLHAINFFIPEVYLVGLHEGDGYWKVVHSGLNCIGWSIAIFGPTTMPIKALLLSMMCGWTATTRVVERPLNHQTLCGTYFGLAHHECSLLKRLQYKSMMGLAGSCRLVGTFTTPIVRTVRCILSRLVSAANWQHGVGIEFAVYYFHLNGMYNHATLPLLFFLYVAGFFSADGCILLGRVTLGQSNQYILEAIAAVIGMLPGCTEPRVSNNDGNGTGSPNSRSAYVMVAEGQSMCAMMVVYFGSFDYMRRSQWLILLLFIVVKNANIPNEGKIVCLLRDLLCYIKRKCPS